MREISWGNFVLSYLLFLSRFLLSIVVILRVAGVAGRLGDWLHSFVQVDRGPGGVLHPGSARGIAWTCLHTLSCSVGAFDQRGVLVVSVAVPEHLDDFLVVNYPLMVIATFPLCILN